MSKSKTVRLLVGAFALVSVTAPIGCGDDASLYENETLSFEAPVAKKQSDEVSTLDLKDKSSDEFFYSPWDVWDLDAPLVPWAPYPIFDYYLDAIPYPDFYRGYPIVSTIHPFYDPIFLDTFWGDDDRSDFDERWDDDDSHWSDDDNNDDDNL